MEHIADATANLTLGEIHDRDVDNLTLVYKSSKKYAFDTKEEVERFLVEALERAAAKFGVDVKKIKHFHPNDYTEEIQKQLEAKQVTLEKPRIRRGEDSWRSGIYIYFRNEIAFFISLPKLIPWNEDNENIVIPGQQKYMIVTNVA